MGHHSIHVVDCSSVVGFADLVDQIEVAVVVADLSFVDFADSVGVDLGFVVAVVFADQTEVAVVVAVGFHFAGFVAVVGFVGFVDSDADYAVDLT